jgi:DNA-binding response OmpR family regulator
MNAIAQSNSGRTRGRRLNTQTILVVDDEPGIRRMVSAALERAGYSVLQASGANEALETAKRHDEPIGLMITDLGLPDADGRDLAARISRVRPEIKIMFMSGSMTLGPAASALFLQKPFALSDLFGKVRALIRT